MTPESGIASILLEGKGATILAMLLNRRGVASNGGDGARREPGPNPQRGPVKRAGQGNARPVHHPSPIIVHRHPLALPAPAGG